MPEGIEIEIYRRQAEAVVGRKVSAIEAPDAWVLKGGTQAEELQAALVGERLVGTLRIGKLLLLETSGGDRLGLRFGMTGRLIVDGSASIDYLEYSSQRDNPAWDRFALHFDNGGYLTIRTRAAWAGVELNPDESRLGVDVMSIGLAELNRRVFVGDVALKARLLDQSRVAGVGNLIADEVLWRSGVDPARSAGSLTANERRRVHRHLRSGVEDLFSKGGSHMGKLQSSRKRGGCCPRDGAPLLRREVGGRTTYSCPEHQR